MSKKQYLLQSLRLSNIIEPIRDDGMANRNGSMSNTPKNFNPTDMLTSSQMINNLNEVRERENLYYISTIIIIL